MQQPTEVQNLALYLDRHAKQHPDQNALITIKGRHPDGRHQYSTISYRALARRTNQYANALEAAGIRRGTKTILMVKPNPEFYALIFALFKVGTVPVLVDPGMGIGRMLHCLRSVNPEAFVGIPVAHVIRVLFPRYFKSLKTWITVGKRLFWKGPVMGHLLAQSRRTYPAPKTRSDELAAISFTTGSTGPAKPVECSHGMFCAMVELMRENFGVDPSGIDMPTFPIFAVLDVALGLTVVLPDMNPTKPAKVNAPRLIRTIRDQKVTTMFASPALLNRVAQYGVKHSAAMPSLQQVFSGGAPVGIPIMKQFGSLLRKEAEIFATYGATEGLPISMMGSKTILSETKALTEQGHGVCIGPPPKRSGGQNYPHHR